MNCYNALTLLERIHDRCEAGHQLNQTKLMLLAITCMKEYAVLRTSFIGTCVAC